MIIVVVVEGREVDTTVERVLQVCALSPATACGDVERIGWRMNDGRSILWRYVGGRAPEEGGEAVVE